MNSEQQDLRKNINRAAEAPAQTIDGAGEYSDMQQNEYDEKAERKRAERPLKIFGGICIAVAVAAFVFSGTSSVNTSETARKALKDGISTTTSAGMVLLSNDENVEAKDYTITHKSDAKDTKIWVWDYAAEDGDYVQVFVNGAPLSDAFMIKHKTREFVVPATAEVQIKGIKDGGGGITYAVRYEINGTSYFNGTPEGQLNTYTLKKK